MWLEAEPGKARIMPVVDQGFTPAHMPELVVIGPLLTEHSSSA